MRIFMLFLIGLTFGVAGGFVIAAANGITLDGHDHSEAGAHAGMDHGAMDYAIMGHGSAGHAMAHDKPLEVAAAAAPSIAIMLTKDPMSGYNLRVMVDRFAFAPQSASLSHVDGEGHAHVFVNGQKLARLYGEWLHIDSLPKGDVEVEVSLNTNDHRPLAIDGALITAKTMVQIE